jgi:hypothetical protein
MRIAEKSQLLREAQELTQAYASVFDNKSPAVQLVIKDLMRFCRARKSTFHIDPRAHALMEGRREVWLRIDQYSTTMPEDIVSETTQPMNKEIP